MDGVETDRAAVTTLTAAQDSDQPSATRVSSKVRTSYGVANSLLDVDNLATLQVCELGIGTSLHF